MTPTPDFVDTLNFLSDTQCMLLREADLDVPAAFEHITVEHLLAPPFNLTLGKASRVLAAAQAKVGTTPTFAIAPPAPMSARIEQALATVAADPAKASLLVDLGVSRVVLGVDDKVSPALTLSMRAQEAAGVPVGPTWQGQRVVETARLASPTVYCSPRTGSPLQAGADEVSGVLWGELGLDGLRETAFGYQEGLFEGRPEEAVFSAMKGGGTLREKVLGRMRALSVKPESLDRIVVFTPTPQGHVEVGFTQPATRPGRSLVANLSGLLMASFSAEELRRFLLDTLGRGFVDQLPAASASLAALASEAADKLIQQRYVDRDLRDALYRMRPRRAADIDAVFSAAGI